MKRGFSLMESLIVIAVIVIIAAIIFGSLNSFRNNQALVGTTELVVSTIREARSRTLASKQASQYGVHFSPDEITLFKGSTYNAGNAANEITEFPTGISLTNISLAGGSQVIVFSRLSGVTPQFGTITLSLNSGVASRTVTVKASGVAGVE